MASFDRKIKVMSLNVCGLRSPKKRRALFRQFKVGGYDVVALQETHLLDSDKELLKKEWRGTVHLFSNLSKGMLTLFNTSFVENEINEIFSTDRCIMSELKINGKSLLIINIYAPPTNDREKIDFLHTLQRDIALYIDQEEENVVILGDFNIVNNNKLDIISGEPHSINSVNELNKCINDLQLNDIWRLEHPNVKRYTWKKPKDSISRRLDYIFISDALIQFSRDSDIAFLGFSDHSAISFILDFTAFQKGPSTFKLNVNVLKNVEFIDRISIEIRELYNTL